MIFEGDRLVSGPHPFVQERSEDCWVFNIPLDKA